MNKSLDRCAVLAAVLGVGLSVGVPAMAAPYVFNTGDPDGRMATASRPGPAHEIESADDFVVDAQTRLTSASFTGLLPDAGSSVLAVTVEIYRVFPSDSADPPGGQVPTRVNSPADVAFQSRSSDSADLSFVATLLNPSFTAANSVVVGINPVPNEFTGGEGAVTGQEVRFDVTLSAPLDLAAGHYFFVPQVALSDGNFLWLSAPRPIVPPGTPFAPDLQSWIRDEALAPDWLRVGTDITHEGPFNAAFSLSGDTMPVPEPQTGELMLAGLAVLSITARRARG